MTAADAIKAFIEPLAPDWRFQLGKWTDGDPDDRFLVLKPAGGPKAELVRRPQFTLYLIGAVNDPIQSPQDVAEAVIEAMRTGSGDLVSMQPGEPVFMPTNDGRPVFEVAISAITN